MNSGAGTIHLEEIMRKITHGSMIVGQRVAGITEGTDGERSWTATWRGEYVGSWMDEGELYNYFRDGEVNGMPQSCFGHPAADQPDAEPTILDVGTLVDMGGPNLCRVTKNGAKITKISVTDPELSPCCRAFVTFSGDGELYCKKCYGAVTMDGITAHEIRLPH